MPNSSIWSIDRTLSGATTPEAMAMKEYSVFPKTQPNWLFNAILVSSDCQWYILPELPFIHEWLIEFNDANLFGAVEYTYCISAQESNIPTQMSVLNTTLHFIWWQGSTFGLVWFYGTSTIVIIIIIIISCWQHGYPWPSLANSSLSFIALGRSSGQQPVSSHSCWMYVRAGRSAFARPCVGIHKSTSLMSSSLLLQQCPACLVRLTWIVFVIGGRCPYSWCLVGCCCQDLFRIARSILV